MGDVDLEPMTEETSLIVREWRNSIRVNHFMDFKEQISIEDQKRWFNQVSGSNDYYFIIRSNKIPVGLIHLNKMNLQNKSAYAGLFIGNESYEGTGVTFRASVLLLDFAFSKLELAFVYAKVHHQNTAALDYNKTLGFCLDGEEGENFLRLSLSKGIYFKASKPLLQLLTL